MNRQKMSTFKKSFDSGDYHEVNENKHIIIQSATFYLPNVA